MRALARVKWRASWKLASSTASSPSWRDAGLDLARDVEQQAAWRRGARARSRGHDLERRHVSRPRSRAGGRRSGASGTADLVGQRAGAAVQCQPCAEVGAERLRAVERAPSVSIPSAITRGAGALGLGADRVHDAGDRRRRPGLHEAQVELDHVRLEEGHQRERARVGADVVDRDRAARRAQALRSRREQLGVVDIADGAPAQALGLGVRGRAPSLARAAQRPPGWSSTSGSGRSTLRRPRRCRCRRRASRRPRALFTADDHARAVHSHGSSYIDVVRAFRGAFPHVPDLVAFPRGRAGARRGVGVVRRRRAARHPVRRRARAWSAGWTRSPGACPSTCHAWTAGARGRPGLASRADPGGRARPGARGAARRARADAALLSRSRSSSRRSAGWIATRAAGHFATGPTHIDDLVESVRAVTVGGDVWESRRLPASGAGPSPDRMLLGSEGTLAVITSAWVRVRPRPPRRRSASVTFPSWRVGVRRGAGDRPVGPAARQLPARRRRPRRGSRSRGRRPAGPRVRGRVSRAPTARSPCAGPTAGRCGRGAVAVVAPGGTRSSVRRTCATRSSRWGCSPRRSRPPSPGTGCPRLISSVSAAVLDALGGAGSVTCRLTHAYPDGAAPYFTVLAPAAPRLRGGAVAARSRPWRATQCSPPAARSRTTTRSAATTAPGTTASARTRSPAAMRAAKDALDPHGLLNPGVLWEPT